MSEMIERVAKALCVADGFDPDGLIAYAKAGRPEAVEDWKQYQRRARAAIKAMREPTRAMMDCLYDEDWPADAERAKLEQRRTGNAIVPYESDAECVYGQYQRLIDAALTDPLPSPDARPLPKALEG